MRPTAPMADYLIVNARRPPPRAPRAPFQVNGVEVAPGHVERIDLPVARLATQNRLTLPLRVYHGRRDGPTLWLSAAIHGDELNGLRIIQHVTARLKPHTLRGTVIAAPVVNVFGFFNQQRSLPDGRDLNRSFPGSRRGSLAARLANLFMTEIVDRSTHGIDLHTAGGHRVNLPQVRADLGEPTTRAMARAFAAPIMIQGESPRGSLREAVAARGLPILVYEAGEPHRFNPEAIDLGVKGVLNVMGELGMVPRQRRRQRTSMETNRRTWVRARASGVLRLTTRLGHWVTRGDPLCVISDIFGDEPTTQYAPTDGLVIGHTHHPLVHQGDALVHLARDVVRHQG
mgnify:CR=1 FL=1